MLTICTSQIVLASQNKFSHCIRFDKNIRFFNKFCSMMFLFYHNKTLAVKDSCDGRVRMADFSRDKTIASILVRCYVLECKDFFSFFLFHNCHLLKLNYICFILQRDDLFLLISSLVLMQHQDTYMLLFYLNMGLLQPEKKNLACH